MELSRKSALMIAAMLALMATGCKQEAGSDQLGQQKSGDQSVMPPTAKDNTQGMQGPAPGMQAQTPSSPTAMADDSALTAKVKAAIVAEPELSVLDIKVDTANGVVTLSGTIDTPQKLDRATQVVQAVDGVKTVNNQLSLKGAS